MTKQEKMELRREAYVKARDNAYKDAHLMENLIIEDGYIAAAFEQYTVSILKAERYTQMINELEEQTT